MNIESNDVAVRLDGRITMIAGSVMEWAPRTP